MAKSPAFQFYPKDWLSSLKVLMLNPAQEGAYIRLLCYCWDSGDCSLPDDDDQLAAMSRLGEGWFKGGSTMLRKCFAPHPNKPGFLTNPRLLEEAVKQQAWKDKSSKGGKQSAEKRRQSKGGSSVEQPKPNRPVEPKGNSASASSSASKSPRVPFQAVELSHLGDWAKTNIRPEINLGRELEKFKAYWRSSKKSPPGDGVSGFQKWLLNAVGFWEKDNPKAVPKKSNVTTL